MDCPSKISRAGKRIYEIAPDTSLRDIDKTKKFVASAVFIDFNFTNKRKPNNVDKLLKDIRWKDELQKSRKKKHLIEPEVLPPRPSSVFMNTPRDRYYSATSARDTKPAVAHYNINFTPVEKHSMEINFKRPSTESRKVREE
jgi:hypothetical protein